MNVKDLKIYLREVLLRLECYEDEQNVELSCNTYGMSGDLLDPESPRDEVLRLSQDAQKCFRKATVRMGNGASLPYAPEIIYKTIYLLFY